MKKSISVFLLPALVIFGVSRSDAGAKSRARQMERSMSADLSQRAAEFETQVVDSTTGSEATPTAASPASGYITPSGGGNASSSGNKTAITQLLAAGANLYAATQYTTLCSLPYGAGSYACPLAAAASLAAGLLGGASGGSGAAGASMAAYDPAAYNYGSVGVDSYGNPIYAEGSGAGGIGANGGAGSISLPDGTNAQTIARDAARIRGDLAKAGMTISPDGKSMTSADGRKFDLSKGSDGSEKSLLDMGLSAAEASAAMAASKKIGANVASKYGAMGAKIGAEGGGGGGGRSIASEGAGSDGYGRGWLNDPRLRERKKAQVSGLTKKLGNDTIGVSGDNIFEMVTRRYKARDQVNQFLKD